MSKKKKGGGNGLRVGVVNVICSGEWFVREKNKECV